MIQTEANVQQEIKDRFAIFQELTKFAGKNSSGSLSNYIAREQTAQRDTGGDYTELSNRALSNFRGFLASAINNGFGRQIIDPLLLNYSRVINSVVETNVGDILRRLYLRSITPGTTIRVKSRNISFGSVVAGSNLGNGTIRRLTQDAYGFDIEACHMEVKRAECTRDANLGAELNEEAFFFRGATPYPDQLLISGSGAGGQIDGLSARKSFITNPSFSQFTGAIGALTSLTGWTPSTLGNFTLQESDYYRGAGGLSDPTPRSVVFASNGTLSQAFDVNNVKINPDVPIYMQLAYKRSGNADGRLTLRVGNVSVSVDLTTVANGSWLVLMVPLTYQLYPRTFASSIDPSIVVTWAGRTTGTLAVDDIVLAPFTMFNGTWYAVVGGSNPFVANNRDTFSWSDVLVGTDSVIQQWLWKLYGAWLPSVKDGSETWTDPTV